MEFIKSDVTTPSSVRKSRFENLTNSSKKESYTPIKLKLQSLSNTDDSEVRKIIVAVRVRPFNASESELGCKCPLTISDNEITVNNSNSGDLTLFTSSYSYDNVFWSIKDKKYEYSSQKKVFESIALPLLNAALEGYNVCLFAYGQTGSGKSYSIMGRDNNINGEEAGIIPRFCDELLKRKNNITNYEKFELSVSYYEIYNEKIHDLLNSEYEKISLRVREHPVGGPYVEGLSKHQVNTREEMHKLLLLGNNNRVTSATVINNRSSRSHAILELHLLSVSNGKSVNSKVNLVDLAGSERVSMHSITGEHFKEGLSINKSLLTLGKVITLLSDRRGNFIPYRESVLTWLLKESLGGNSRTVMLATVSPSSIAVDETLSTLRYACQARHIVNKIVVNEDPQLKLIRELKAEVDRLKSLHDYKKNEQTKIDGKLGKDVVSITSEYVKYENELLNIEKAQKIVEEQLQAELSRIGLHLQAAERRKDELETQKNVFLEKLKNKDVSQYKSDFYENLQDILNNSIPSASVFNRYHGDSQVLTNLDHLNTCLSNLKSLCENDNGGYLKQVHPLVQYMEKCYQDICQILNVNQL